MLSGVTLTVCPSLAGGGSKLLVAPDLAPTPTGAAFITWQAWGNEGRLPVQLNEAGVRNDSLCWASLQNPLHSPLGLVQLTFNEASQEITVQP